MNSSPTDLTGRRIGFLGLGHMGLPMAVNLVQAGADLIGFDVVDDAVKAAQQRGITISATAADAVRDAEVVITMFPTGAHVLAAYQGDGEVEGLLAAAPSGTVFLDCSTIDSAEAREAAHLAHQAGHVAADAPVSGGVIGAEQGTLAFMVGAEPAVFERIEPLLDVMGARVVLCGTNGLGQAAKICNNLLLGITMIGASEAFVLGERLGLTHQALYDVVSKASGQCWAVTTNCPVPGPVPTSPANRDFEPGFAGALMAKDLGLAVQALEQAEMTSQLGTVAAEMYRQFAQGDGASQDFSAIINTFRERP